MARRMIIGPIFASFIRFLTFVSQTRSHTGPDSLFYVFFLGKPHRERHPEIHLHLSLIDAVRLVWYWFKVKQGVEKVGW
uniref:Putative secreted protein n=1 Tax=Anopheles marajoara TaxID=58244 RepID=A0A2M4CC38_9DIPT